MSVKTGKRWRLACLLRFYCNGVVAGALILAGAHDGALAQGGPFGMSRSQGPAPVMGGILGWIFAKQAEFYRQFSGLIRAAKADGSAAWSLMGLSFLYGIFHAAGPGHGKAVISSYLVANEETWKRGVVLSFVSALVQALVAVLVVGIAAALLNATAATMGRAVNVIEILSYSLIVLIGVRLLWVKGRAFIAAAQTLHRPAPWEPRQRRPTMGTARTTVMAIITIIMVVKSMTSIIIIAKMTHRPGAMPMRPSPRSSPARADGSAASPRSSP